MIEIPLDNLPNQSFNIQLAGINYELFLRDHGSIMTISILIAGILKISGTRAIPGFPLIPYKYLENGNFLFLTTNDEYPDYTRFGVDQYLIYANQAELNGIRSSSSPILVV